MRDGIMLTVDEDGTARIYDDTYDIVIHCESQEEHDKAMEMLRGIKPKTTRSGFYGGEKGENETVRTTDDLISKTDVCEILADVYPTDGEKVVAVKSIDEAYDTILALPSATCGNLEKPERPQHSEGEAADCNLDCISRQAALNALSRGSGCGASCHRAIKDLPSVQPSDEYSKGWHDGRKALREEIWEDGRDRLD